MAAAAYLLCAATALLCTVQLWRGHRRTRATLLLWFGLCFAGLTLDNLLLFVDRILLPRVDLSPLVDAVELLSLAVLLYGMIWKSK